MAKFTSEHASLIVYVDGKAVKFVDGVVEASGKAADKLREIADEYGIAEVEGASEAGGYAKLSKADLQAEIDRRNEEREDDEQIVRKGANKPDLVAALEADDAAQAE